MGKSEYILNNKDNVIKIIDLKKNYYDAVYTKEIKNPKKDLQEAYKVLLKLNREEK